MRISAIDEAFRKAIIFRDPAALEDALARGADVDTSLHFGDGIVKKGERGYAHALSNLLVDTSYLWKKDVEPRHKTEHAKTIQMVQLLLTYTPDLLTQDDFGKMLVDGLVIRPQSRSYQDPEFLCLVGTAVIQALTQCIEQKKEIYTYSLAAIFKGIGDPDPATDQSTIRRETAQVLQLVHEHVRQRLLNPASAEEHFLVRHADQLGYWHEPLALPDIDTLPRPSQAFCDAVKSFGEATRDLTKTKPGTEAARMMLHEARFERDQLDKLVKSGGHIQPLKPSR